MIRMRKPALIKKSSASTLWSLHDHELTTELRSTTEFVSGDVADVTLYTFNEKSYEFAELYEAFSKAVPRKYASDMLSVTETQVQSIVLYCDSKSWEVPVGASRAEIMASRNTRGDGSKAAPWQNLCVAIENIACMLRSSCPECLPLVKLVVTGIVDYPVSMETLKFSSAFDFGGRLLIEGADIDIRDYSPYINLFDMAHGIYLANCTFKGKVGGELWCIAAYDCTSEGITIYGDAYRCEVTEAKPGIRGTYCYECSGSSTDVSDEFFRGKYCVGCSVDAGSINSTYVYGCTVDNGGIFADSLISESSVSCFCEDRSDVGLYTEFCCHSNIDAVITHSANSHTAGVAAPWDVNIGSCGVNVHFDCTDARDIVASRGGSWFDSRYFMRDCTVTGSYTYTGNSTNNSSFTAFGLGVADEVPYNCSASISYSGGYGRATLLPMYDSRGQVVHNNELHWCNIYGDKPDAVCIGAESKRVDCNYPEYVVEKISFCEYYRRVIDLEAT
jgi:hypothetical protein